MENKHDVDTKAKISREKALELLFKTDETHSSEISFFDEYAPCFGQLIPATNNR